MGFAQVKVTQVGNSTGIVLPKEALSQLGVAKGDTLFLVNAPEGLLITAYDPRMAALLDAAEEGERKYRHALRELAK